MWSCAGRSWTRPPRGSRRRRRGRPFECSRWAFATGCRIRVSVRTPVPLASSSSVRRGRVADPVFPSPLSTGRAGARRLAPFPFGHAPGGWAGSRERRCGGQPGTMRLMASAWRCARDVLGHLSTAEAAGQSGRARRAIAWRGSRHLPGQRRVSTVPPAHGACLTRRSASHLAMENPDVLCCRPTCSLSRRCAMPGPRAWRCRDGRDGRRCEVRGDQPGAAGEGKWRHARTCGRGGAPGSASGAQKHGAPAGSRGHRAHLRRLGGTGGSRSLGGGVLGGLVFDVKC